MVESTATCILWHRGKYIIFLTELMPVLVEVIHMQARDWQRCMQELC